MVSVAMRSRSSARRLLRQPLRRLSSSAQLASAVKIHGLIKLIREQGHCVSRSDPLQRPRWTAVEAPELASCDVTALASCDVSASERVFVGDELPGDEPWWVAGDVLRFLRSAYCGSIGIEYAHIASGEHRRWWRERFERSTGDGAPEFRLVPPRAVDAQRASFELLLTADRFEHALATRLRHRRFGSLCVQHLLPRVTCVCACGRV